ncbi:hypothetical protein BBF96_05555 [Anoxybacter fermentans]|uniref:biotin synthase n=1 Tax=Anoxybacter fermentans TaxID=1323375 RepID=A0A3Q9HPX5_9FIRM|nr:radical SAM protein [Anoxybacter fermentans]AZR72902.1 hypothetical protein BBF96_05555 [Anoxybacter fermentans]
MRVSIGTAHLLGLKEIKIDALPTTAYLMHGEGCRRNCKFCAQAFQSGADSRMLSRVVWPEYDIDTIVQGIRKARKSGKLKRCCIQTVDDGRESELAEEIKALVNTGLPLCVSKSVNNLGEIRELLEMGVERVTISLDVVNPERYNEIKGGSFKKRLEFLLKAAQTFPGQIGTHIIIGLGETEEEAVRLIAKLAQYNVEIALFAFTPLKGTPLAHLPQPNVGVYRRIQMARFLIMKYGYEIDDFQFSDSRLVGFNRDSEEVLNLLNSGKAFETSGCPDCNRPYYNERPGGVIYNYPRPLKPNEIFDALKSTGFWSGVEIYSAVRQGKNIHLNSTEVGSK